jgi:hypothetical protein
MMNYTQMCERMYIYKQSILTLIENKFETKINDAITILYECLDTWLKWDNLDGLFH